MENDTSEIISKQPVTVKVSRLAIIAISLALCGLIFTFVGFMAPFQRTPSPISSMQGLFLLFSFVMLIIALILGFISMIRIEASGGKKTGRNFAVGAILISLFMGFISLIFLQEIVRYANFNRIVCGVNLSGIGKAMLIYANDYDNEFPRAGSRNSIWSASVKWDAADRYTAYGIQPDGTGGKATISSSLYLLVKYSEVTPKSFICVFDRKVSKFDPSKYDIAYKDLTKLWDFGPEPRKHCSFAYHMPYGSYPLTTSSEPGMAVAADRNPWVPSPGGKEKKFTAFNPDGNKGAMKAGNCYPHQSEGQNVLYLDSHVDFKDVSFCGVNEDNIYTSWNGSDIRKGTPPKVGSQPASNTDSMLVNDAPPQKP